LPAGQACIEIPKLGAGYSTAKRVCDECFQGIIQKTSQDLDELRAL
jgi:hypothetical protein